MVKAQDTKDLHSIKPISDIADNTNQYFWFDSEGVDTGAHITEVPQDEWKDSESEHYHSGGNLLARSNGIAVRSGLEELAVFGAEGMRVGKLDEKHIEVLPYAFNVYDEDGSTPFAVSTNNSLTTKVTGAGTAVAASGDAHARDTFTAYVYLKGTIQDDRIYFGTSASGYPTAFDNYVELTAGATEFPTPYVTTVVNGVSCSARWDDPSIVRILFENTGSSRINVAYRLTDVYYETSIKANDASLGVRSKSLLLMNEVGSSFDDVCYVATYGHIAQVSLGVYNTASIPVNAHIYRGILGEFYPERPINLIGKTLSSGKLVYGQINPLGTLTVYNTTGAALATSTSDYIWLTGTYIYK